LQLVSSGQSREPERARREPSGHGTAFAPDRKEAMRKTTIVLGIGVAFLLGTMTTAGLAFAGNRGSPFDAIIAAINALTAAVRDIELLQGPQGPAGPAGPPGPKGDPGAPGVVDIYYVTRSSTNPDDLPRIQLAAFCEDGDVATGGGFQAIFGLGNVIVTESVPRGTSSNPVGWSATFEYLQPDDSTMTVYVMCADVTP
jgi:hypothetical protein